MSLDSLRGARVAACAALVALSSSAGWPLPEQAVTFASAPTAPEAREIQSVLESYVRAIESKDIALFKKVKPNMTADEARRAKAAFDSIRTHAIAITIQAIELQGGYATVRVARRDTLNASIVNSFSQVFEMSKDEKGWSIREMRR